MHKLSFTDTGTQAMMLGTLIAPQLFPEIADQIREAIHAKTKAAFADNDLKADAVRVGSSGMTGSYASSPS